MRTWLRYNAVSAAGVLVQAAILALLTAAAGWHIIWATAAAVEVSVLHNFVWHWRWTFSCRSVRFAPALLQYHLTTGVVSVTGNTLLTHAAASGLGFQPLLSNAAATVACYLINWWLADAVAFRRRSTQDSK